MRVSLALLVALSLTAQAVLAQAPESHSRALPLGTRVVAGTLGSAAGALAFGAAGTALTSSCPVEDWGCVFSGPLVAGAVGSVIGSVAGTHLLARWHAESPSLGAEILAASVGVFAGTLVGAGLMHAVSPEDERWFVAGFSVTQGALTAFASRHTARRGTSAALE